MNCVLPISVLCVVLAQDRPKLAVHPLEIQAERHEANLRIHFAQEVLQRRISSIETRQIPTWLAKQPQGSCQGKTACLQRLAEEMGASYALYASLTLGEQSYEMTGRIVRADGRVVRDIEGLRHPRSMPHRAEEPRQAMRALLEQLQPEALPIRPHIQKASAEGVAVAEEAGGESQSAPEAEAEEKVASAKRKAAPAKGTRTTRAGLGGKAARQAVLELEPLVGLAPSGGAWGRPALTLRDKPLRIRTAAYIIAGAGAAALASGGILGFMAQRQKNFLNRHAPDGLVRPGIKPHALWTAHKKAKLYPKIGGALAGTGVALGGVAAALFLLSHHEEEGMPFMLAASPNGVSVSFQKSF